MMKIKPDKKPDNSSSKLHKKKKFTDPQTLLKALSSSLGMSGEIKSKEDVPGVIRSMKDATKLVEKCTFIDIIRATDDKDVLKELMKAGGWDILYDWLKTEKSQDNTAFLIVLMKAYDKLPVSVSILKKNACAKTIKQLSKSENDGIKKLATALVDKWMRKIKGKSDSSNHSDKKKSKHNDHHRSSSSSSSSLKDPHSTALSAAGLPEGVTLNDVEHNYSKSNGHDRTSEERSNTASPSSSTSSSTSTANSSSDKKAVQHNKPRAKTVKTVPSKFRSTGLEQETVLPQVKKKSTDTPPKPLVKRPSTSKLQPQTAPKKPRPTLPPPISTSSSPSSNKATPSPATSPSETPGKIKLISPLPRTDVYESSDFMNALTSRPVTTVRKRKRAGSISGQNKPGGKDPTSPTSSSKKQPAVMSFYTETLDTGDDKDTKGDEDKNGEDGSSSPGGNSVDSKSSTSKVPKKKVSWAEEKLLRSYHYFEMNENERVNVNRIKDFEDTKKKEMMMERQGFENAKKSSGNTMENGEQWERPPRLTGLPEATTIRGCNSKERENQKKREQGVLQAIYFSKEMIPESAAEAEVDADTENIAPKTIPLEDETGSGSEVQPVVQPVEYPPPVTTIATKRQFQAAPQYAQAAGGSAGDMYTTAAAANPLQHMIPAPVGHPAPFSLPPEVASLVASLTNQTQVQMPQVATNPQAIMSDPTVQTLIMNIMQDGTPGEGDLAYQKLKEVLEPYKDQFQGMNQSQFPTFAGVRPPVGGMMGPAPPGYPPPFRQMNMGPRPMGRPPMHMDGMQGPRRPWMPGPPGRGGMMRGPPGLIRGARPMAGPRIDRPVCTHFMAPKGCRFGAGCRMLHPGINGPPL